MGAPALPALLLLLLLLRWLLLLLHRLRHIHASLLLLYTRLLLLLLFVPRVCWGHHQRHLPLVYIQCDSCRRRLQQPSFRRLCCCRCCCCRACRAHSPTPSL
jgi:hypothetical protein